MIKKLVIDMLGFLGKLWSFLYSPEINQRKAIIKAILYSGWISREFRTFGKKSMIFSPCDLLGGQYISIGDKCSIGKNATLTAWDKHGSDTFEPQISIGNNVRIGDDCHITAINKIVIGDNVLTGKRITITDNAHGNSNFDLLLIPPASRKLHSKGPVIIEKRVWIGEKVTILSNVRIGENSIIGANSVVTRDLPANCIAGGIPARVIKLIE